MNLIKHPKIIFTNTCKSTEGCSQPHTKFNLIWVRRLFFSSRIGCMYAPYVHIFALLFTLFFFCFAFSWNAGFSNIIINSTRLDLSRFARVRRPPHLSNDWIQNYTVCTSFRLSCQWFRLYALYDVRWKGICHYNTHTQLLLKYTIGIEFELRTIQSKQNVRLQTIHFFYLVFRIGFVYVPFVRFKISEVVDRLLISRYKWILQHN